jgi:hypothetical protein
MNAKGHHSASLWLTMLTKFSSSSKARFNQVLAGKMNLTIVPQRRELASSRTARGRSSVTGGPRSAPFFPRRSKQPGSKVDQDEGLCAAVRLPDWGDVVAPEGHDGRVACVVQFS